MAERLREKTALVMGAGSSGPGWGNGKAVAVLFAREGAKVICVDINVAAAAETAAIIRGEGGFAEAFAADATDSRQVKAAVDLSLRHYGKIDILHNNIGICEAGGVVDLEEERWDHAHSVNLKSCFLAMKHVVPIMVQQGGGSIINISSISAIRYLGANYISYYSTKAALNSMTRATAAEYAGRNVRVNTIMPGHIDTPMAKEAVRKTRDLKSEAEIEEVMLHNAARVPMGRWADAWDIANAAVFFASDESRFITGAELVVDGGVTLMC